MKKLFWLLFGTGLAIAVIAFTLSDNTLSYFFNFLLGLSTNIFGLIITIFFAQKYIDAVETKNRKAAETNEILRHDRIMQQFILLYLEGYASIAIPNKLDVSEIHINVAEDDEFAFTDLAGMYDASLMIPKKGAKSSIATVYKGNIIKNLIMDCQSYTKYRPNETTGGIFVSWRRKEELPTGA